MLLRFLRIQGDLVHTSENSEANFVADGNHYFSVKVQMSSEMLAEIDTITKSLQGYGRALRDCADNTDVLMEAIQADKYHPESHCTSASSNRITLAHIAYLSLP